MDELSILGAENVQRATSKVASKLMTNDVMMLFSLHGKKKKLPFNTTVVYKLLVGKLKVAKFTFSLGSYSIRGHSVQRLFCSPFHNLVPPFYSVPPFKILRRFLKF